MTSLPSARNASSLITRCFSNKVSKGSERPTTCLLRVNECDLQVNERVHSFVIPSVFTPQCLSALYSLSLHGSNFSLRIESETEDTDPRVPLVLDPFGFLDPFMLLGTGEQGDDASDKEIELLFSHANRSLDSSFVLLVELIVTDGVKDGVTDGVTDGDDSINLSRVFELLLELLLATGDTADPLRSEIPLFVSGNGG